MTIGAILALLAFAVALFPFVRRGFLARESRLEEELQSDVMDTEEYTRSISAALEGIYEAIRTLQLERELGSVPEGLYREQLNSYRLQAAMILREQEGAQGTNGDAALEEEIRLARVGLARIADGESFCPNCARPLSGAGDNCPECGVTPKDLSVS